MDQYFNQGWNAFEQYIPFKDNPFTEGTVEAYNWEAGWLASEAWDVIR